MNLPPFPDDYIPTSPEARRRLIAWGMDCARMGAETERLSHSVQPSSEAATGLDAERYRWLRNSAQWGHHDYPVLKWHLPRSFYDKRTAGERLDAAIDAARADGG